MLSKQWNVTISPADTVELDDGIRNALCSWV
jgi:hypothetical protein